MCGWVNGGEVDEARRNAFAFLLALIDHKHTPSRQDPDVDFRAAEAAGIFALLYSTTT